MNNCEKITCEIKFAQGNGRIKLESYRVLLECKQLDVIVIVYLDVQIYYSASLGFVANLIIVNALI